MIGDDAVLEGPFGARRIVYADYTASGRALTFIEDFVRDEVLPLYANTHTESSATGLQTTRLREDARRLIHRAVGGSDDDVVLFYGSGATGAIDKLVQILGLRVPAELEDDYHLSDAIPAEERPVVFVGPYEHHSNELPWRESIADVVTILEDADGRVDLGSPRAGAAPVRGPASEDREFLRRLERDRDRDRRRSGRDRAPPSTARSLAGTTRLRARTSRST